MKKLITFITLLLILTSCKEKEWRYEIKAYITKDGKTYTATWLTDNLEIGEDFVKYKNSDGSEVIIKEPFVLIDHKYDKKK